MILHKYHKLYCTVSKRTPVFSYTLYDVNVGKFASNELLQYTIINEMIMYMIIISFVNSFQKLQSRWNISNICCGALINIDDACRIIAMMQKIIRYKHYIILNLYI